MTDDRKRLWILGASDPEMELIEELLREAGEQVRYAAIGDRRIIHDQAYRMDPISEPLPWGGQVILVECDHSSPWPLDAKDEAMPYRLIQRNGVHDEDATDEDYLRIYRVDHHRPGDPGYGRPPSEFMPASSVGQVIELLALYGLLPADWRRADFRTGYGPGGSLYLERGAKAKWAVVEFNPEDDVWSWVTYVPDTFVLAAAADHCLAAAYRGECPGVDPDKLMSWRIRTRAAHQGRPEADVRKDVERAREILRRAPRIKLDPQREDTYMADLSGVEGLIPELPEAAARDGVCFIALAPPSPDGRVKVVCQSGTPEQIRAFMEVWAPYYGLRDIYGDPARGFAGGYRA